MKQQLIVFTGLPGTGKSSVAEAVGRQLQIPVFAKDWLEAVLLRYGPKDESQLGLVGYDLLTTLAARQLSLSQSVILDSVASTESIRTTWRDLTNKYHAAWKVIECVCADESLHRRRLTARRRNIPGWHELTWVDVEKVKSYYAPWHDQRLILDMASSLEENISRALQYLEST